MRRPAAGFGSSRRGRASLLAGGTFLWLMGVPGVGASEAGPIPGPIRGAPEATAAPGATAATAVPGASAVMAASGVQNAPSSRASADTVRARVLDRIRGPGQPPGERAAPDTLRALPEDLLDPRVPLPDTAGLQERLRAGADTVPGVPARPQHRPPTLPSGADAFMRELIALPGYDASVYEGNRADYQARDRIMVLHGTAEAPARFQGQGTVVEADSSITYDDRLGRVRTSGRTVMIPEEGERVVSDRLVYDLGEERGSAIRAQTTYDHGGRWIVTGDLTSVRPETGEAFGRNTAFTSCELDPPHTYFRAAQYKVVRDRVLVARSVQMVVEDVPVMWLPFLAQNLGTGRASGLLTPTFSMNDVVRTSTGYDRRISNIGYYWAMSDYSDMTLAMEWFSNNYTALRGSSRYRWSRQFLEGNLDFSRFWQETGSRQLTVSTRHSWTASERTRVRANARYASSSGFVRQNTFDPRELNQTIDSDASLNHRFDWGTLSLGANRKQFLNEERVDMTLPSANLSLSTMTLFAAPPQDASWYNNLSMSGSARLDRDLQDREIQPETDFSFGRTSQLRNRASARGSLGLGRLSLSGNVNLEDRTWRDVPETFLPGLEGPRDPDDHPPGGRIPGRGELGEAQITWSSSLSFQQRLMGATTFTPSVSVDGRLMQVDSIPVAQDFVSGPVRVRVGAGIQTDLYGFYPGFGNFEGIRHKITPNLRWSYAPAVTATELQARVFGARDAGVQNIFTFGFNQTWEAKVREPEQEDPPRERAPGEPRAPGDPDADPEEERIPDLTPAPGEQVRDTVEILRGVEREDPDDVVEDADPMDEPGARPEDDGLRRLPESRVLTLLGLQTQAVTYDVTRRRDETGRFVDGFTTTSISNSLRSDFLQGLSLSFTHDLFEQIPVGDEAGQTRREFRPHLSQLSLSFSLGHRSGLVRAIGGLLGLEPGAAAEAPDPGEPEEFREPGERPDGFDPNRIVPGDDGRPRDRPMTGGGWNASISYSLRRPRETPGTQAVAGRRSQMIQSRLSFQPTPNWQANWSTTYDLEEGRFNDHSVNLTRDLHEWEATFSFRQTALGNWAFQFEVSLRANRDLRADFRQRSLDGAGAPPPGVSPF